MAILVWPAQAAILNLELDHAVSEERMRLVLCLMLLVSLTGCGVVAFPFRVTGDAVQAVPVVGKPIGKPIHAVGDAID